jgi:hypothetical protein
LKIARTKQDAILGINYFLKDGNHPSITLIPDSPSEIKFTSTGSAEYIVSKGTISSEMLSQEKHCEGGLASFRFSFKTDDLKFSLQSTTDIFLNKVTERKKVLIDVTWDTNLAQTEYSSGLLNIMNNFENIDLNADTPVAKLDRKILLMFSDPTLQLKIGVDVLRNLAIQFDHGRKLAIACKPKYKVASKAAEKFPESSELHGIAVKVQRRSGLRVWIKRSDKSYLELTLL